MKSFITTICVLIPLVILFIIIDRKDYYFSSDVAVQQETVTGMRPTTGMTLKPVEPQAETKPVEVKPMETRLAETKPVAKTKPTETKSVAEKKPVAKKLAPAAIPIVTAEEAEKLNEEAKDYLYAEKEKKEPFYSFYKNNDFESITFEGTILATSSIPDTLSNDYEHCLYAILVEIDSILSTSSPIVNTIDRTVIINTPIMKGKNIIENHIFKIGDKISCTSAEYDEMPQNVLEIQLSDDIQSYEYQQFFPFEIKRISSFQKGGNKNFAKREITIFPIQSIPEDKNAIASRHNRIQEEILRIENELREHGGSFASWKEEYKPIAEDYARLCKQQYKGWIKDSYFEAGGEETVYFTKDYIDGILPYKMYLEKHNIDLIVVRVPSKWDFSARVLTSEKFHENPAWIEHYYECLKSDIEIVDPMPEMWEHRFDYPLFYYSNDKHPFEGFSYISANVLSAILKERYKFKTNDKKIVLKNVVDRENYSRSFWPSGNILYDCSRHLEFKGVFDEDDSTIGPLNTNSGSPFLFLSNSFFAHPDRLFGASVPGYTAFFIQSIPDWFYQAGTYNPLIRNLITKTQILNNRKAIIMVGHPDSWKGFPIFPRYLSEGIRKIVLEKTLNISSHEILIQNINNRFDYSFNEDGTVSFELKSNLINYKNNEFALDFNIQPVEGRNNCMVRINFLSTTYLGLTLVDRETNNLIDSGGLPPGRNQYVDFFVPLSNISRPVRIVFHNNLKSCHYDIENIELWYY